MKNQHIIILGATSGIGKALAHLYMGQGAKVGIAARRTAILQEMAQTNGDVIYETCDIQQSDDCVGHLQHLAERLGRVDLFILCTGIGQMNASLDTATEQDTIRTNVVGWTAVADWAFNLFRQQGFGHLAAISSIASLRGLGPAPSYSATKAYQAHYLEALHQLALASGLPICVTNIRPGFVKTPLLAHPEKFFWVVPVDRAALQIAKGIEHRKSTVTVTRRWRLMVPIIQMAPNCIIARLIRRVL